MRRTSISSIFGVILASVAFGLLGTSTVTATECGSQGDRGWPSYNPAQLAGCDNSTAYPPGGTADTINTRFLSSIPYGIPETWVTFNGTSDNAWWGCCPWNPNDNKLSDSWSANGIAVSVSLPPSISATGSGGGPITYQTDVGAYWQSHHNFSGVQFNAADIWSVVENACSAMQFSYDGEYHCTQNHSTLV